jgi:flagellar biosynthesis GTPase FlhF
MRVRTFTAPTMPDAMAQVRAELGEDAIILSSQRGRRGVEIRAAAERKPAATLENVDAAYGRLAALEAEMERRLLADYEATLDDIEGKLSPDNHAVAVALASLPEKIRGFGHVKERHVAAARAEEANLMERWRSPAPATPLAAE